MFLFTKEIQSATALTMTGATATVELDENVDYSALLLRFAFTADSSQVDATKERIIDWLTSLTIIGDDDKYVVNASAIELAALAYYHTGIVPRMLVDCTDNAVNVLELPILFGHHVGDLEYFLPGGMFNKLELNVTNGDSATGNFFDAGTLQVMGLIFKRHALSPLATLRTKQIKSWTPPSSTADMTEELPDKHLIEKLLIEGQLTYQDRTTDHTAQVTTLIDKLKLTYNGGDVLVFEDDLEELIRQNALQYGLARTLGILDGQENDFWDSGLAYVTNAQAVCAQDPSAADLQASVLKSTNRKIKLLQQGTAADNEYYIEAIGSGLFSTFIFDWMRFGNRAYLYDPATNKKGELKITAGSTAGLVNLVVVEHVTSF